MLLDRRSLTISAAFSMLALALGCSSATDNTVHTPPAGDSFLFTSGQVSSLDSTGQVVATANPGNSSLSSLLDSTLQVLTAGVTAKKS